MTESKTSLIRDALQGVASDDPSGLELYARDLRRMDNHVRAGRMERTARALREIGALVDVSFTAPHEDVYRFGESQYEALDSNQERQP